MLAIPKIITNNLCVVKADNLSSATCKTNIKTTQKDVYVPSFKAAPSKIAEKVLKDSSLIEKFAKFVALGLTASGLALWKMKNSDKNQANDVVPNDNIPQDEAFQDYINNYVANGLTESFVKLNEMSDLEKDQANDDISDDGSNNSVEEEQAIIDLVKQEISESVEESDISSVNKNEEPVTVVDENISDSAKEENSKETVDSEDKAAFPKKHGRLSASEIGLKQWHETHSAELSKELNNKFVEICTTLMHNKTLLFNGTESDSKELISAFLNEIVSTGSTEDLSKTIIDYAQKLLQECDNQKNQVLDENQVKIPSPKVIGKIDISRFEKKRRPRIPGTTLAVTNTLVDAASGTYTIQIPGTPSYQKDLCILVKQLKDIKKMNRL